MTSFETIPLAPGEREEIISMVRGGSTTHEVSEWIGCSLDQVRRVARNAGLRPRRIVAPQSAAAARMARDGYTATEIGAALGMTRNAALGAIYRARQRQVD